MIDYLEQLFRIEEEKEQGGEEISALPGVKPDSEPVEFRVPAIPEGEEVVRVSTKPAWDVENFTAGRQLPGTEPVQEGEAPSTAPVAPRRERSEEGRELERRLRRASRRYDSGFYRY